ncbi:hypothetical protein EV426DRAFT_602924 [Tirmania nivea]|nr:hypothetical protein EV426DRAFT_602924 [Tirmania nivea]
MESQRRYEEKPLLHQLNIEVLLKILNRTFLNPFFAWLGPFAFRAQGFQYHHAPMWGSAVYAGIVTIIFLFQLLNTRLAYGKKREFDWTEEVVVITGGAGGLGLLIAEVYGMRGVSVAVLDVKEAPEGGKARNVTFYKCDVGDLEQVKEVKEKIEEELGIPTVVINNAAVMYGKNIVDLEPAEIERTIRTNLLSHFYTIKTFLPAMQKLNKGTIVTISSALAHIAPKHLSDYAAAKAAVSALHHALTADLGGVDAPIKTLLVEPGQMSSDLFAGVDTPSNFFAPVLEPVDIAKEIIATVDAGNGGILRMPSYSRWIGLMNVLPVSMQRLVRWWSGCDEAMVKRRKVVRERLYSSDDEEEEDEKKVKN